MNPLVAAALGSIFRWALTFVGGYFVAHGIWTDGEATEYVTAGAAALVSLLWVLYTKYRDRANFLNALHAPAGSSEDEVKSQPAPRVFGLLLVVGLSLGLTTACAARGGVPISTEGQLALRGTQTLNALETVLGENGQPGPLDELVTLGRLSKADVLRVATDLERALDYARQLGPILQLVDAAKDAASREQALGKASAVVNELQQALYNAVTRPEGEAGRQALSVLLAAVSRTLTGLTGLFPPPPVKPVAVLFIPAAVAA